jgi:hypothetical protein
MVAVYHPPAIGAVRAPSGTEIVTYRLSAICDERMPLDGQRHGNLLVCRLRMLANVDCMTRRCSASTAHSNLTRWTLVPERFYRRCNVHQTIAGPGFGDSTTSLERRPSSPTRALLAGFRGCLLPTCFLHSFR